MISHGYTGFGSLCGISKSKRSLRGLGKDLIGFIVARVDRASSYCVVLGQSGLWGNLSGLLDFPRNLNIQSSKSLFDVLSI